MITKLTEGFYCRCDNMQELLDVAKRGTWDSSNYSSLDWAGGTLADNMLKLQRGAIDSEMKEARELYEKIDSSFRERETHAWLPSVTGAYPVVPEYLIGMPLNMRQQQAIEADITPLRIVVEVCVSSGVSHHELIRRGAALSALVMRSSEERPVELWIVGAMRNDDTRNVSVVATKLASAPVNLSQCVAAFAMVGMARSILFNVMTAIDGRNRGGINWAYGRPGDAERERKLRAVMELSPQDVVIQGGYLPDAMLMKSDPVEWVHKQLEKQRTVAE